MSGSKTKYSVASSTSPLFDLDNRINQFEAAMLDYTSNSVIEYSEYMKSYYNTSRLSGYKQFINWWRKQGNESVFGKVTSTFYGDADIDNTLVAQAIEHLLPLTENDTFSVFNTTLNFFSEDFFIRHLATQQGKGDWFTTDSDSDYEIDYPNDDNYIVATFKDGRTISGYVPDNLVNTRFLEISYSILTRKEETTVIPPKYDEEGNIVEEGSTVTTVTFQYNYGYYQYRENSGIPTLDTIIKNNGISEEYTFFPPIPLRTDTAWFTGDKADRIESALTFLEMYDSETKGNIYPTIQKGCTEGLQDGSINDIDYITMLFGVSINSIHPADCRYLYEFFFNLYANQALKEGVSSSVIYSPKDLTAGNGSLASFFNKMTGDNGHTFPEYKSININCVASNLNLSIKWVGSDYFEANGQFKPGAKRGDYGVLCGRFTHKYSLREPARDNEGNLITSCDEDGCEIVYETNEYSITYDLLLLCHQYSNTRWHFVCIVDPYLVNLVYAGKTVETDSWSAFEECTTLGQVTHDFRQDFPSAPGEYHVMTLNYIVTRGNATSAFVIPLEWNTFMECGIVNQTELTYGCVYLVFNSWVKYKTGGFFSGFFGALLGVITIVIGAVVTVFCPYIGVPIMGLGVGMLIVSAIQIILPVLVKILSTIFGEKFGNLFYSIANLFLKIVIAIIAIVASPYTGGTSLMLFWGAIGASTAMGVNSALQEGASIGDALLQGVISGASTYVTAWAAPALGNIAASGLGAGINTFGSSMLEGESFGESLLQGITTGIITSAVSYAFREVSNYFGWTSQISSASSQAKPTSITDIIWDAIEKAGDKLIKNPAMYVELMKVSQQEAFAHKLNNLENDYQEFNNSLKVAYDSLYNVGSCITSTVTAEYVCKLQANIGKLLTQFPDAMSSLSSEEILTFSTATGMDFTYAILSSPNTFVENKLTMNGYTPEILYYNQQEIAWLR